MLQRRIALDEEESYRHGGETWRAAGPSPIGIDDLLAILRRRLRLIAGIALTFPVAMAAYLVIETPRYLASATIVLDAHKTRPNEEIASLSSDGIDAVTADSQVEIIKSESVALGVIDKLQLDRDPAFLRPRTAVKRAAKLARSALNALLPIERREGSPRDLAVQMMSDYLIVERAGATYAISIAYGYPDAQRSAEITNAVVEVYQQQQALAKDELAQRTSTWLKTRLNELRQRSLTTDFEIQRLRQDSTAPESGDRTIVLLRDLEREADTYKRLYQTFLSRYQQAVEQDALPIDEVRVVTVARAPIEPAYPKKLVFLAAATFLGLTAGLAAALGLEYLDGTARTGRAVREALGLPCLGTLPRLGPRLGRNARAPQPILRPAGLWQRLRELRASRAMCGSDEPGSSNLCRHVETAPDSIYAEAVRSLMFTAVGPPPHSRPTVIGLTSMLHREGKSCVGSNLALTLSAARTPVVLVDGDLRRRRLTQGLGLDLSAPADAAAECSPALKAEIAPGLTFVAPPQDADAVRFSSFRLQAVLKAIINDPQYAGHHLLVDLPPFDLVADVAAALPLIDHVILVVEWGQTPLKALAGALADHGALREKCLGVVLNRVDLDALALHDPSGRGAAIWGRRTGSDDA